MPHIVLEGHIEVPQSDLAAVLLELPNHVALTRSESGCVRFEVKQRAAEPRVFDVREEFDSQSAFDRHQARVRASVWGATTVNVERHYTVKEVSR